MHKILHAFRFTTLCLTLAITPLAQAQIPSPDEVEAKVIKLEDNLHMLMGIGGNIAVSSGPDGVFIVDDDLAPMAPKIKAAIATFAAKPVSTVFNTHWHFDHAGGNKFFSEQGATVIAPTRDDIAQAFDAAYHATYGRLLPNGTRRVMNLRSAVIGRRPKFDLSALAPDSDGTVEDALKGSRNVHFADRWFDTAIYDRLSLPVGAVVQGPASLEQLDTTILIEPGLQGAVDAFGNVIIERCA